MKTILTVTALSMMLLATTSAQAIRWDFGGNAKDNGWVRDGTRARRGNVNITFTDNISHLSTQGGKLIVKSDPLPTRAGGRATGGGMEHKTAFNKNNISAKCAMKNNGSSASLGRSQAAFWLDVSGANSTEVDIFERKPPSMVVNFLVWQGGTLQNGNNGTRNLSLKDLRTQNSGTYKFKRAGSQLTVTAPGQNNRRFTALGSTGNTIIVHNKPWRFFPNSRLASKGGPTATLECDYIDQKF